MHVHYDKHKRRKQLVQAWFEDVQKEKMMSTKSPMALKLYVEILMASLIFVESLLNTYNMSLSLYLSYASYELKT